MKVKVGDKVKILAFGHDSLWEAIDRHDLNKLGPQTIVCIEQDDEAARQGLIGFVQLSPGFVDYLPIVSLSDVRLQKVED